LLTCESRSGDLGKIDRLEIQVTSRCPLKCVHCSLGSSHVKACNELSLEDIVRVISEFSEFGGKTITITGGEPFVRSASFVMDVLKAAKDRSLLVTIYTSGYFMNESLARKLRENKVSMICISIEGLEATHDMITGVAGSFDKALMTLRLMQKYEIPTRIHFTPMRINYREFGHIVLFGKSLGADSIKILDFSPQGRGRENRERLELTPKETDDFVSSVKRVIREGEIDVEFGGLMGELSNSCSVGRKISVTSEGFALPCLGLQERIVAFNNLGNIKKDPFHEICARIGEITSDRICFCNALKNLP